MNYKDFWKRTNALIKHLNKTQRGLALECGFTERRIETLSSCNRSPDVIEAVKIAAALNTTVEYLVTGNENSEKVLKEQLIQRISYALNTEPDKLMAAEPTTSYSADKKPPKN